MSLIYNAAKTALKNGSLDLLADDLRVMLVDGGYTAAASHAFVTDGPGAAELAGTGYTGGHEGSGRLALDNRAVIQNDAANRAELTADDVEWPEIEAGEAAAVVIFRAGSADDSDAALVAHIDDGGFPKMTNGGSLSVEWSADGVLNLT